MLFSQVVEAIFASCGLFFAVVRPRGGLKEFHLVNYVSSLRPFSREFLLAGILLLVQFFLGLSKRALTLIRFMDVRVMVDGFCYFFVRDGSRDGVKLFVFVFVLDFCLDLDGFYGAARNEDEGISFTTLVCCYLTELRGDGVTFEDEAPFFKHIDENRGEFTNKSFKFDSDLCCFWQSCGVYNGFRRKEFSGFYYLVLFF